MDCMHDSKETPKERLRVWARTKRQVHINTGWSYTRTCTLSDMEKPWVQDRVWSMGVLLQIIWLKFLTEASCWAWWSILPAPRYIVHYQPDGCSDFFHLYAMSNPSNKWKSDSVGVGMMTPTKCRTADAADGMGMFSFSLPRIPQRSEAGMEAA